MTAPTATPAAPTAVKSPPARYKSALSFTSLASRVAPTASITMPPARNARPVSAVTMPVIFSLRAGSPGGPTMSACAVDARERRSSAAISFFIDLGPHFEWLLKVDAQLRHGGQPL